MNALNTARSKATAVRLRITRELEAQGQPYALAFSLAGKHPDVLAANAALETARRADKRTEAGRRAASSLRSQAAALRLKEAARLQSAGHRQDTAFCLAGNLPNVIAANTAADAAESAGDAAAWGAAETEAALAMISAGHQKLMGKGISREEAFALLEQMDAVKPLFAVLKAAGTPFPDLGKSA